MKVKVINRNEEEYTRERAQDLKKVHRNYDPSLHQFQKAHEYTRALNAAKLERVFAKPFIAALTHSDGITCLARNPRILNSLLAGSADGDIRVWDVPLQRTLRHLKGHTGAVRGIAFAPDGETCVSCGTDCSVSTKALGFVQSTAHQQLGGNHYFMQVTLVVFCRCVDNLQHFRLVVQPAAA